MRAEVLELVVFHDLLGVADQLEDQQVPAVGQHEGPLLPQRGVVLLVELIGVAPDELVLERPGRQILQARGLGKGFKHFRFDPDHVAVHVRRPDLQARDVTIVIDVRLTRGEGHVEVG